MKKYIIKPGDTLGSIAEKFYNDPAKYKDIAAFNSIPDPNIISVGKELFLPDLKDEAPEGTEEPVDKNTCTSGVFTMERLMWIMPNATRENVDKYLGALNKVMQEFEINTNLRAAHFIAQLAHESGSFKYSTENLNYSTKALRTVFGKYFPTVELAEEYARKPEKIANIVYANRMGNGDEESGEGWKYRGRGLIQLTGKANYIKCGEALGIKLVSNPDILSNDAYAAVAAAGWFWNR